MPAKRPAVWIRIVDPQNRGPTVDAAAGATGATAERTRESMKVGPVPLFPLSRFFPRSPPPVRNFSTAYGEQMFANTASFRVCVCLVVAAFFLLSGCRRSRSVPTSPAPTSGSTEDREHGGGGAGRTSGSARFSAGRPASRPREATLEDIPVSRFVARCEKHGILIEPDAERSWKVVMPEGFDVLFDIKVFPPGTQADVMRQSLIPFQLAYPYLNEPEGLALSKAGIRGKPSIPPGASRRADLLEAQIATIFREGK